MSNIPSMQQLLEAGVHFGHQVRRGHPKMGEYIFGVREGVHIINLEQSEKLLQKAADFAYKLGEEGKVILFVGTKKQAEPIIKEEADKANSPYVNIKWIGGLLTNFDEIRRNIKNLEDLAQKKEKGEFGHYTKKERLLITRKLEKFQLEQGGLATLSALPDALFVVDCVGEKTAIAEANRLNIPVMAIADTNCNPLLIGYPIPGNDDASKSIKIITEAIVDSYLAGLKAKQTSTVEEKAANKKKVVSDNEGESEEKALADDVAEAEVLVEKEEVEESERKV